MHDVVHITRRPDGQKTDLEVVRLTRCSDDTKTEPEVVRLTRRPDTVTKKPEYVSLTRRPYDIFDAQGKVIPSRDALQQIEREYPAESAAKKWRLAQLQTLFSVYGGRS